MALKVIYSLLDVRQFNTVQLSLHYIAP